MPVLSGLAEAPNGTKDGPGAGVDVCEGGAEASGADDDVVDRDEVLVIGGGVEEGICPLVVEVVAVLAVVVIAAVVVAVDTV